MRSVFKFEITLEIIIAWKITPALDYLIKSRKTSNTLWYRYYYYYYYYYHYYHFNPPQVIGFKKLCHSTLTVTILFAPISNKMPT